MKYILYSIITLISLSQRSYSQEKIDWNTIKKIEIYSLGESKKNKEFTSKEMNSKTLVKCESEKLVVYFKQLEKCKFDVLTEKKQYALRIYFSKTQKDFLLFLNQGVMFEMKNWKCFSIIKKDELKNFIEDLMKKNGL
ncbi:hypothetical protein [Flavobacterium sp.]|uniref:hypothetical protein n=1 Tax=Flavobacterium sp. TaxID=239 RepID=UPI0026170481|nr:hypothetical protein [Flavobacterium sp.]